MCTLKNNVHIFLCYINFFARTRKKLCMQTFFVCANYFWTQKLFVYTKKKWSHKKSVIKFFCVREIFCAQKFLHTKKSEPTQKKWAQQISDMCTFDRMCTSPDVQKFGYLAKVGLSTRPQPDPKLPPPKGGVVWGQFGVRNGGNWENWENGRFPPFSGKTSISWVWVSLGSGRPGGGVTALLNNILSRGISEKNVFSLLLKRASIFF